MDDDNFDPQFYGILHLEDHDLEFCNLVRTM
jgi:hypothetical protein